MTGETDLALLLLRVMAGLMMAGHGAQKLFGWWNGSSPAAWAANLERQGFRPARAWAALSLGAQVLGGVAVAAGLLTPLSASLALVATMVVVVVQKWPKGFFNTAGGYEFMLTILVIGVALVLAGPGSIALDAAFGLHFDLAVRLAILAVAGLGALEGVLSARPAVPAKG